MSKIISEGLKKHNGRLNMLKYHVKTAKDEDERQLVQNEINTIKLVYNLNQIIDRFGSRVEKIDERYKEEFEAIFERLKELI